MKPQRSHVRHVVTLNPGTDEIQVASTLTLYVRSRTPARGDDDVERMKQYNETMIGEVVGGFAPEAA